MPPADESFEEFFRRMLPRALAVGRRVLGDAVLAEDAAVEALAKAHVRWRRVGSLEWRDGWLLKVTAHEALRLAPREPLGPLPVTACSEEDETPLLRAALVSALRSLPRRQREAVALRYLCDLSEEETARALGVSRGAVKTHVHRALASLRSRPDGLLKEWNLDESPA